MEINKILVESSRQVEPSSIPQGKQSSESYQQWGHRMAGLNQGNVDSLDPHLQIVYQNILREQRNDAALQEELRQQTKQKIDCEKVALEHEENGLKAIKEKQEETKKKISEVNEKIDKLKGLVRRKNAEAMANFIIGLFIIVPLTVYLFIFYSSTAYSAFFKQIDFNQALGSHMFDAQALTASWEQSWATGLFVLLITFLFMALGFILHQFTKQEGALKYFKAASIIIVTFVFDTLLAFLIAKNMYDAEGLTRLSDIPPYTFSMAAADPRFWIVIFCGFLAYIIWGLLFGFIMDSYNNLDMNKIEKDSLVKELDKLMKQETADKEEEKKIQVKITQSRSKLAELQAQEMNTINLDYSAILLQLNNFFSGWTSYLNAAVKNNDEIKKANDIFARFVQPLKTKTI